jgi:type III restriction enzyme
MSVEIKFDSHQQFQLDAISSVVELFAGQEGIQQDTVDLGLGAIAGTLEGSQEIAFGNTLSLDPETIGRNLRRVQDRPILQGDGTSRPAISAEDRQDFDIDDPTLDFSVEMETGTGKTYVYLRTIAELNNHYGFSKFVIVVPSIAIREGVLSNLQLLAEHIRDVYDGLQYDSYVYDSQHLTRVRQFATASHLQILVINIDSFTSDTNVINRPSDAMNGYAPIEFLRACQPIVVMDEPQNMETPIRQEAIRSLRPAFRLRYSATHRDPKHLVHRLTPVDAYDLRLVKRIGVLSIVKDEDFNEAYVSVKKVSATPGNVTATAKIHKATKQGTKLTQVTLHKDDDLFEASGQRDVYRGWLVEDIHAPGESGPGFVEFGNGVQAFEGSAPDSATDQQQRLMIRFAIEQHFQKELQLRLRQRSGVIPAAIKPLTLFFIDRVANYHPAEGKFRLWFEEEYARAKADGRFLSLEMPDVADVHDGYFATTQKGVPSDRVQPDGPGAASAFERIMRNKEQLLSFEEPLRFIFSHSALAEGWDNPNVFTICNLQVVNSEMRKRQQIGRGLRLPVMENGERCRVDDINLLTVIAHEEFSEFAEDLQTEIEEETGVRFTGRLVDLNRDRTKIRLKEEVLEDPLFLELWEKISKRATYRVQFETDAVVAEAVKRIDAMEPLEPIKFRISSAEVEIDEEGVGGVHALDRGAIEVDGSRHLPDLVGELSRRVPLSRATVVRILQEISNLDQVEINPSVFADRAAAAMNEALYEQVTDGIVYEPDGEDWSASLFKTFHSDETVVKPEFVVSVTKSVTDKVICDSNVEVDFAKFLEARDDVPLFLKLPGWFVISTPLGNYNPDWAFVRSEDDGEYLYLVRETKGTDTIEDLQWETEGWKIKFGEAHFRALGVDYDFGDDPEKLIQISRS